MTVMCNKIKVERTAPPALYVHCLVQKFGDSFCAHHSLSAAVGDPQR